MSLTVEEFIQRCDVNESGELSSLNLPDDPIIQQEKIKIAIEDAKTEFRARLYCLADPLPVHIEAISKRKIFDIARYYLDYLNPRTDVRLRYEDFVQWAESICPPKTNEKSSSGTDDYDPNTDGCGIGIFIA